MFIFYNTMIIVNTNTKCVKIHIFNNKKNPLILLPREYYSLKYGDIGVLLASCKMIDFCSKGNPIARKEIICKNFIFKKIGATNSNLL